MEIQKKKRLTESQLAECAALKEIFNSKKDLLGLTQEKAAQHLGMNQGSFSHYLNGRNAINLQFALSVAKLLGVSVMDFAPRYERALSDLKPGTLDGFERFKPSGSGAEGFIDPRSGQIRVSGGVYPLTVWGGLRMQSPDSDSFDDETDPDMVASTEDPGANGYWVPMHGPSMVSVSAPCFPSGSYLLIKPQNFELKSGKFYLARHASGDYAVRQYIREAGSEYLIALNNTFPPISLTPDWALVGMIIDARIPGI